MVNKIPITISDQPGAITYKVVDSGGIPVNIEGGGGGGGSLGPSRPWCMAPLGSEGASYFVSSFISEVIGFNFAPGAYIGSAPGAESLYSVGWEFAGEQFPCGVSVGVPINDDAAISAVGAYMWPCNPETGNPIDVETLPPAIPAQYEIIQTPMERGTHPVLWITLPVAPEPDDEHMLLCGWLQG